MFKKCMIAVLIAILAGCNKDNNNVSEKPDPTLQLLTQKEWILSATGFDDDKNGLLDAHENTILPCQSDNSYSFHVAGTGVIEDNALVCGTPVDGNFNWQFVQDKTMIKIDDQEIEIFSLNENELILSPDIPGLAVKFMLKYRH